MSQVKSYIYIYICVYADNVAQDQPMHVYSSKQKLCAFLYSRIKLIALLTDSESFGEDAQIAEATLSAYGIRFYIETSYV